MAGTDNGERAGHDYVIDVLTELISGLCGIDESQLTADSRVADLGIDSLIAGEIIARAEVALHTEIDIRLLSDDWSGLTLGSLAAQVATETHAGP
jgi:acyl carrier protein